ncbi:hypothetical protein PR048_013974 [Dryococelus australis]|uniref:Uncharacterized protein n=1 Tax=Dryococelus australis TaxID=614101 RepID=A0ABQ9HTU3_9NEOP|nr:hypothetical protein PR048_013974 [Dryococelus australis]
MPPSHRLKCRDGGVPLQHGAHRLAWLVLASGCLWARDDDYCVTLPKITLPSFGVPLSSGQISRISLLMFLPTLLSFQQLQNLPSWRMLIVTNPSVWFSCYPSRKLKWNYKKTVLKTSSQLFRVIWKLYCKQPQLLPTRQNRLGKT